MHSPHHTPTTSPKKPSPLSYATSSAQNSPRESPFRRAQSPATHNNNASFPAISTHTSPRARTRTPSQTVRAGTSAAPAPDLSRSPTGDVFNPPIGAMGFDNDRVGRESSQERPRTPNVNQVFGNDAAALTKGKGASPAVPLASVEQWSPSTSSSTGHGVGGPRLLPSGGRKSSSGAVPADSSSSANANAAVRTGSPTSVTSSTPQKPFEAPKSILETPNTSNNTQSQSRMNVATQSPKIIAPRDIYRKEGLPASKSKINNNNNNDITSNIHPARLREMHESFQVLDRDSDGLVDRSDVAEMLAQLGQPNDPNTLNDFLPTATPPTHTNLPSYINNFASLLAPISPIPELSAAFSAFDTDDSGQIDVVELRAALVQGYDGARGLDERDVDAVLEEFGGRRMFAGKRGGNGLGGGMGGMGKRGGGGEVFRWREFIGVVAGGGSGGGRGENVRNEELVKDVDVAA